jgi:hypothetical protein
LQLPAYSKLSSTPDKRIDRISLRGAALPDPDHPFLISPLPQFTTPLTTSNNFSFTPVPPLPELTNDLEDEDDEATDSETEHEAATPTVVQQDLRDSNGLRRLSFQTDGPALARSGPYLDHRRARSGSSPEMYTSPSSVKVSADASQASPPKSATLSQSQQVQHASSSREGDASSHTRSPLTKNPDGGVLRTRLHDLLRDSAMSSSLPNMSASHFPPSLTNRGTSSGSVSPLPPRSDSSNTNKTPLPSSSSSDTPPQPGPSKPLTGVAPTCNFAPRQGFSSASTEAKKLEEERKRKLKEEKQQSSRLEKSANDMDRESHMSKQPSTSTSTQTSNNPRREQPSTTSTGTMVSNSRPTSSTRRGQSFSGTLGRSGSSIVSPSKEEHDTFAHQNRYVNHISKARGAIHSPVDSAGIYA